MGLRLGLGLGLGLGLSLYAAVHALHVGNFRRLARDLLDLRYALRLG